MAKARNKGGVSWRNSNGVAIAAGAVIFLSLVGIIWQAMGGGGGGGGGAENWQFPVWCYECEWGDVIVMKADGTDYEEMYTFPKTCQHCGQAECYPVYYCSECGTYFPVAVEFFNYEIPPAPCPECGNEDPMTLQPLDTPKQIVELGLAEDFRIPLDWGGETE